LLQHKNPDAGASGFLLCTILLQDQGDIGRLPVLGALLNLEFDLLAFFEVPELFLHAVSLACSLISIGFMYDGGSTG
jgi:hypothetical protein